MFSQFDGLMSVDVIEFPARILSPEKWRIFFDENALFVTEGYEGFFSIL
jgi:hypothetical protein